MFQKEVSDLATSLLEWIDHSRQSNTMKKQLFKIKLRCWVEGKNGCGGQINVYSWAYLGNKLVPPMVCRGPPNVWGGGHTQTISVGGKRE